MVSSIRSTSHRSIHSLLNTDKSNQPPKRTRSGAAAAQPPKEKKARQSKLAKQNDITGEEEAEIKEAFHLFCIEDEDYEDEKEGVIPTQSVRKALMYAHQILYMTPNIRPRVLTGVVYAEPSASHQKTPKNKTP